MSTRPSTEVWPPVSAHGHTEVRHLETGEQWSSQGCWLMVVRDLRGDRVLYVERDDEKHLIGPLALALHYEEDTARVLVRESIFFAGPADRPRGHRWWWREALRRGRTILRASNNLPRERRRAAERGLSDARKWKRAL